MISNYSTKMHLLELSTMIHVVRNQIKCILVNERPRDISLARLLVFDQKNGRTFFFFFFLWSATVFLVDILGLRLH